MPQAGPTQKRGIESFKKGEAMARRVPRDKSVAGDPRQQST